MSLHKIFIEKPKGIEEDELSLLQAIASSIPLLTGCRLFEIESFKNFCARKAFEKGVYIVPIFTQEGSTTVKKYIDELFKFRPYRQPFGSLFLCLNPQNNLPEWVEALEAVRENALPIDLIFFQNESEMGDILNICSSISGMLREIENMEEIARISEIVEDLETKLTHLNSV